MRERDEEMEVRREADINLASAAYLSVTLRERMRVSCVERVIPAVPIGGAIRCSIGCCAM